MEESSWEGGYVSMSAEVQTMEEFMDHSSNKLSKAKWEKTKKKNAASDFKKGQN